MTTTKAFRVFYRLFYDRNYHPPSLEEAFAAGAASTKREIKKLRDLLHDVVAEDDTGGVSQRTIDMARATFVKPKGVKRVTRTFYRKDPADRSKA